METTFDAVRAEALFASSLQMGQAPGNLEVREAVTGMLRRIGIGGCVAQVATEFGEHPETAAPRMRWALERIQSAYTRHETLELTLVG